MQLVCEFCKVKFERRDKLRYCSLSCSNRGRAHKKVEKVCALCDAHFKVFLCRDKTARYCSEDCRQISLKGEGNPRWKGGKVINEHGYRKVYRPDHPHAMGNGKDKRYVLEHRLVMEKHLGRYLNPLEIVHHVNSNKLDNRIENLELVTQSQHSGIHGRGNVMKRWGKHD